MIMSIIGPRETHDRSGHPAPMLSMPSAAPTLRTAYPIPYLVVLARYCTLRVTAAWIFVAEYTVGVGFIPCRDLYL